MTNTPTNYSYDTIPGTVEEDAPKKDKNVRRKKTVGVVASGILGVLCLAFLVIGYGSQDRPGGGTTAAASSSSVSVLPLDPVDRVADCHELCASRPLEYCKTGLNLLYNYYADSEMVDFESAVLYLCVEDEQVCFEECSSVELFPCEHRYNEIPNKMTFMLCMLWNCQDALRIQNQPNYILVNECFKEEQDYCDVDAFKEYLWHHRC